MLNIILLDSGLELVPKEIANHPSVIQNAKKRGKNPTDTLLDISIHYHAMKKLNNWIKRGRPDIIHMALIMLLSEKQIIKNLYIHTIDSKIIKINTEMRPPKNYNRFVPLMEQLLKFGKVPPNSELPLMEVMKVKLKDLAKNYIPILLSENGEKIKINYLCNDNFLIGIGGFQHGDFSDEVKSVFNKAFSISNNVLETHQVVCRLITLCNILT
ncbi:16S rRNA methyltransferase [Acidianus sulfidivorans JP7]|uniref:Ribosomal RNA small subunit methyltransferase Nep1 n=1 Tax=Acidianus sulfidivorans JP7 TaxID=619593 RepID=A0A2U9IKM7_9CREN|nr:16S rRNA methyltransferase [Acidianus sulfidivorans]AWR96545.1 16S rRNA methyltransferase [Acidianus sulfidivorans JP7]